MDQGIQLVRLNEYEERNIEINNNLNNFSTQLEQTKHIVKHLIVQRMLDKPDIMAHRALYKVYPENTIVAFYQCVKRGIMFFETDFRKTSDGQWVCLHDDTTLRTTGVNKVARLSTLAELQALPQVNLANTSIYGTPFIPSIDDVLLFAQRTGSVVNINFDYGLASADVPTILNKIYSYGVQNNVIVQAEFFDGYDDNLCRTTQLALTEDAYLAASQKGNVIAAYNYGGTGNVAAVNNAMLLCNKYNVPMLIYTVENYTHFKNLDKTGVHSMMVDNLWFRGVSK